ncbi:MAG: FAD-dependent oxidoreductase [Bdellovibrionota bacterium]
MSVVVLGGGIAGLSTCLNLDERISTTLLEKESALGGLLKTDIHKEHFFDHGPHLFFHQDPYFLEIFKKATSHIGSVVRAAKTGQWSFQQLIEYPYSLNLFKIPDEIKTKCVSDFVNRQIENARSQPPAAKNYEQYCRTFFGDGLTDHFMIPYAIKIWTVHPRELSTDWVGIRIILPNLQEMLRGALTGRSLGANYIKDFKYPKHGGSQSFVNGIRDLLKPNVTILPNSHVCEIDLNTKTIALEDGRKIHYEQVVSSLPLPDLVKIIKDLPKNIIDAVAQLEWFGVLLLNYASEEIARNDYQWIYFDQQDACFHRIHYPSKLADSMAPEGSQSIQAEISFSKHRPLVANPDLLLERAWKELTQLKFCNNQNLPQIAKTRRIEYAYAIMKDNRMAAVSLIKEYLDSKDFITCGRFGDWDYIWTDKVLLSGKNAAQKINKLRM